MAEDIGSIYSPVIRAIHTGIAAYNLYGNTLYSLFKIPRQGSTETFLKPLRPTTLLVLQARFKGVRYLIINKKSIISIQTLALIN